MACGVHLGLLLVVFVQHVCCSWAPPALNPHETTGFVQQGGGLRRHQLSHQGELRQTSTAGQSRGPAVLVQAPEQNAGSAVRIQSSTLFGPTSQRKSSEEPEKQQQQFQLSTSIVSGSSVSSRSKKTAQPRASTTVRHVSPQAGPRVSSRFMPRSPQTVQMQTSASAPARRVMPHGSAPKPSNNRGYSQPEELAAPYRPAEKATPWTPTSFKQFEQVLKPGQRFAPTKVYNIPERFGGFAIRRLGDLAKKSSSSHKASVSKPQMTGIKQSEPKTGPSAQNQGLVSQQRFSSTKLHLSRQDASSDTLPVTSSTSHLKASRPQKSSINSTLAGVSRQQVGSARVNQVPRPQQTSVSHANFASLNRLGVMMPQSPTRVPKVSRPETSGEKVEVSKPQLASAQVLRPQTSSASPSKAVLSKPQSSSTRFLEGVAKPPGSLEATEMPSLPQRRPLQPKIPTAHQSSKWIKFRPPFGLHSRTAEP